MNAHPLLIQAFEDRASFIADLYDLLGSEVETKESMNYKRLAWQLGAKETVVRRAFDFLKDNGFMSVRYGKAEGKKLGRSAHWTLHKTKEEALAAHKAQHEQEAADFVRRHSEGMAKAMARKSKPAPVVEAKPVVIEAKPAVREEGGEPVEAIAGDEPKSPFIALAVHRKDENAALVEAARQYSGRARLLESKLTELEAAGITIDKSAIHFERDERLEAVSLVIPYIDGLEGRITTLGNQVADLRAKVDGYEKMRLEMTKLRQQNERLIAEKVARSN